MRIRKIILIIGCIGSGKTTFISNFIKNYKQEPIIVYDINREQHYKKLPVVSLEKISKITKGKWRNICPNPELFFNCILRFFRNGVLICDDFDRYQSIISEDIKNMLIGHRHLGLDIILIFHSLQRVMPIIYENTSDIILFKTTEQPDRAIYKLPSYNNILDAYNKLLKMPEYSKLHIKIR